MNSKLRSLVFLLFLFFGKNFYSQADKEKALEKGRSAIKYMDNGNFDESIKLLEEARKLDPDRFDYSYELAYAHFQKKEYATTIKILEENKDHKDVGERLFQLLGNTYDMLEKSDKAFEAYDAGLKKFPNSGMIHLEKGNVYWNKQEYNKALASYEKGIELDPKFPSNYYRAALIYCSSTTEEVWGMLYGEIFINLERGSERTAEISKLLFDTYKSQIKFKDKDNMTVSFCQQMVVTIDKAKDPKNMPIPFCMIYEPTLLIPISMEKKIDLASLDRIRTGFVETYFKMGHDKTHPNILFDYQNKILKAGHLESYNHWILLRGDENEFSEWQQANKEKWENFVTWFKENGLKLSSTNRFYSGQY